VLLAGAVEEEGTVDPHEVMFGQPTY